MSINKFVFRITRNEFIVYAILSLMLFAVSLAILPFSYWHLLVSFVAYPLAIFVHEFGHYIAAKLVKHQVAQFRTGLVCGYVKIYIQENPIDLLHIYWGIIAGGLANLFVASLCSVSSMDYLGGRYFMLILGIAQVKIALISLIPLKCMGPDQDGNQMMGILSLAEQKGRFIHDVKPQMRQMRK